MTLWQTDTLIIGCGIAGTTTALTLSEANPDHQITIITRAMDPTDSNSTWAQGGIVTRGLDDHPDLLVQDILEAGAGLSSLQSAEILATEGAKLVQSILIDRVGVHFDQHANGELVYGLEAAHSRRRVVHVGDLTGKVIMQHLLAELMIMPNITLLTQHTAIDLIMANDVCQGAYILEQKTGEVQAYTAHNTILATGGIGQLFANTSNPAGARGDGVAMAHRAGATIQNAEYVQFHPTGLLANENPLPLVSEAVRGEGACLLTPDGESFMHHYAPDWGDLAPRDVVARAIFNEMNTHGYDYILLDIASQRDAEYIRKRFPTLVENCTRIGIDPTLEPIPVTPIAHYFCGGVAVNEWGQTNIERLYAVGEVSCTGLHGANRLASTSLLEGLVWGYRSAQHILKLPPQPELPLDAQVVYGSYRMITAEQVEKLMNQIRQIMWHKVGIVRDHMTLTQALNELKELARQADLLFQSTQTTDALISLRNAIQTAQLVTSAALANPQSIGAHYRADVVATEKPVLIKESA